MIARNNCSRSNEMSAHHRVKSPLTITEMRNQGGRPRATSRIEHIGNDKQRRGIREAWPVLRGRDLRHNAGLWAARASPFLVEVYDERGNRGDLSANQISR
jgi:hypothetical protein